MNAFLGNLRTHVLRVHSTTLTAGEVYKCESCPCAFKKIGSLNAHIGRFHSNTIIRGSSKDEPGDEKQTVVLAERDSDGVVRLHKSLLI